MTVQPARAALIDELMTGEDPASDTYADALARVNRLVDDAITEATTA